MKVSIDTSTSTGPGTLCAHSVKIAIDGMLWASRQGCSTSPEEFPTVQSLTAMAITDIRRAIDLIERQAVRHGLIDDPVLLAETRVRQVLYTMGRDADALLDDSALIKAIVDAVRGIR